MYIHIYIYILDSNEYFVIFDLISTFLNLHSNTAKNTCSYILLNFICQMNLKNYMHITHIILH